MTRKIGVAVAIWVSVWIVLTPAHHVAAQERSPSPERLWNAYPLDPTVEPGTQPKPASSPSASAGTDRPPVGAARAGNDGETSFLVVAMLVLVAAGGALTFADMRRRRRKREPTAGSVRGAQHEQASRGPGPSGRFSRSAAAAPARSTATVAATARPDSGGAGAADEPSGPEVLAESSPVNPVVAPAPAGLPPDPRLTWAAEIEWRRIDDESRFCVIARGAGTVEIAQSPPLDWPPDGPAAVQAVTDAADDLSATLLAAGWTPQPLGDTWYAKRFTWEPGIAERAEGSTAASRSMVGAKPAESPRAVSVGPSSGARGTAKRDPSRRSRAKQVVLLAVLAAVGFIVALQVGGGSDSPPKPSAPPEDIDLSFPILGLCCVLLLVVLIRQIRRTNR